MRVGILGGTFDPIHVGHLEAAAVAGRAFSLDKVLLMPSRTPPHRTTEPRASVFHRFAMAALAAAEHGFSVSDLEVRREGPSYTAETLEALHSEGVARSDLFFITGADAFADVALWHDYPRILQLANFIVVSRPGAPRASELIRNSQFVKPEHNSTAPAVFSVEADTPDVSSTEIRRRIGAGDSLDGMVPPSVAGHIRRHHLYVPAPIPAVL